MELTLPLLVQQSHATEQRFDAIDAKLDYLERQTSPKEGEQDSVTGNLSPKKAAAVLLLLAGSFSFFRQKVHNLRMPGFPFQFTCFDSSGCHFELRWLHQPRDYPEPGQVSEDERTDRRMFYSTEMLLIFCVVSTLVLLLPKIFERMGCRCKKRKLEEVLPYLKLWTIYNEIVDWSAVLWLTYAHGVYLESNFGLYWEDWVYLLSIVMFAPLAELSFGYVAVDTVALTAFPLTSARLVRIKDKVQLILFLREGVPGIIGGLASASVIFMSPYMMLKHYPEDYLPSIFLVSIETPTRPLNRGSWEDWVFEKLEVQTRDGKVFFGTVHDLPMSAITALLMAILGRSSFLTASLLLSLTKPVVLFVGRLVVLQQLDEWGALYLLQARIYGWLAKAASLLHYTSGHIRLQIRQGGKLNEAGNNAEAKRILQDVYHFSSMKLGERHPATIQAMHRLANSLDAVGETQEALALRQEVLRLRKNILGESDPETIKAMGNLCMSLHAVGETQEALAMRQEVLRLSKDILGERHQDTIQAMGTLAISLHAVGETQEALSMSQEVLRLRKDILSERHPHTILTMSNLAAYLHAVGETQEAMAMEQEVLRLRKGMLGQRHPKTIMAMNNLAISLDAVGETQAALAMRQEVLRLRKGRLGESHPDTIKAMGNLAVSLHSIGETQEALAMRQEVLRLSKDILSEMHPETIHAMSNLAMSLHEIGKTQESLAMNQEVLRLRMDTLGERHSSTIQTMNDVAISLDAVGETQEALAMRQEVLRLRKSILGESDSETIQAMGNLVASLYLVGDTQEALAMSQEMLRLSKDILGESNPLTIRAMEMVHVLQQGF